MFAIVHGHFRHAVIARLLQSGEKQRVGFLAAFIGRHVIGAFQINRIDVFAFDELENLHHARGFRRHLADIFLVNDNVLTLFVLITFHDLVARNRLVFGLTEKDLLDARMILFVELIKADGFATRGREQADGKRNKSEREMPLPGAGCHIFVTRLRRKHPARFRILLYSYNMNERTFPPRNVLTGIYTETRLYADA